MVGKNLHTELNDTVRDQIALGRDAFQIRLSVKDNNGFHGDTSEERDAHLAHILAQFYKSMADRARHNLGYPLVPFNADFEFEALAPLQHFNLNNVGDPFVESNYSVHSRPFEVAVLDCFADLLELERNSYWGYVTSGGTEGNLHGILIGREVFPDGILYTSRDSHYSIFKAARMYRMQCVKVGTLVSGEIDCSDFERKLLENRDKPAVVNLNIGTTMKGAVDDVDLVIKTLQNNGFKDRFYIHCDGALFGFLLPFIEGGPKLTFKKPIGSVSMSGHKFIGCPTPCGVQITRLEHINKLRPDNIEYIASRDATITGSRNGQSPIFLWYAIYQKGYKGFQKDVQLCIKKAHYMKNRLKKAGIGATVNALSTTVVFERPKDGDFVKKWQLACEGNLAHMVMMPIANTEIVEEFLDELVQKRSTWYQNGAEAPPCMASEIGAENCLCATHQK